MVVRLPTPLCLVPYFLSGRVLLSGFHTSMFHMAVACRQTRRSKRKTLVLDLDETLVHSTLDGFCRPDFTFPVEVRCWY